MEHAKRHKIVWTLARPVVDVIVRILYKHTPEYTDISGPFLVVCNHTTDWDPLLMGVSFRKEHIYFVSSEHVLRSRFGKLLTWLLDPIGRQKGGSAADTVLTMMRRLKKGYNVAVFPEGNRSWDGVTREFVATTGKLVRSSGASLVTYRIDGGYFASPRWAGSTIRRGKTRGQVVNVYSPEQLKAMKPEEINQCIQQDLHVDAYEEQRKNPIPFKGRNLAHHMETLLFICPQCGKVHTLHSKDDTLFCESCGFHVKYLPTGFLSGENLRWDNIRDWNLWQEQEIRRLCDEAGDEAIFVDTDMHTNHIHSGQGKQRLGRGDMRLYRDRLELPGVTLPLEDISGISLRGPQDIYFGTKENHYQVGSEKVRCTVKYLSACAYLNNRTDYGV
jgi:1-acyl-sn-glycerol-3-phosphate acyltransferase